MFDFTARAFRFGNVVGPSQTHGVGFDFVRRLLDDPTRLRILGDGQQSKSYVYVEDVIAAVLLAGSHGGTTPFDAFNVATGDYVTVTEIAELAMQVLGLEPGTTAFEYTGGDRGWKGDVPVVRIATGKIRSLGWSNERTGREALRDSMAAMADEARAGLLDDRDRPVAAPSSSTATGCSTRSFVRRRRAGAAALAPTDFELLPGVVEACHGLRGRRAGAGGRHQPARPGARRTRPGRARAHARRLRAELPLDDVVVCPHDGEEGCWCRKPRPGMILDAARAAGPGPGPQRRVGDRWRDIDAAHRAGVASV